MGCSYVSSKKDTGLVRLLRLRMHMVFLLHSLLEHLLRVQRVSPASVESR